MNTEELCEWFCNKFNSCYPLIQKPLKNMINRTYYITDNFSEEEFNNLQNGCTLRNSNEEHVIKKRIYNNMNFYMYRHVNINVGMSDGYFLFSGNYDNLKEESKDYCMIYPEIIYKLIGEKLICGYFYKAIEFKYQNIDSEFDIQYSWKTLTEEEVFLYKAQKRMDKLNRVIND